MAMAPARVATIAVIAPIEYEVPATAELDEPDLPPVWVMFVGVKEPGAVVLPVTEGKPKVTAQLRLYMSKMLAFKIALVNF